jgi:hypothetical protein
MKQYRKIIFNFQPKDKYTLQFFEKPVHGKGALQANGQRLPRLQE